MYCTISELQEILPSKVAIGNNNIGVPVPGRGVQKSSLTPDDARTFIRLATSYIDARLKPLYVTPLRRVKGYEVELTTDVSPGANVAINVRDTGNFNYDQLIRVQDKNAYENATIVSVTNFTTFTVDRLNGNYSKDGGTVSILSFPDPIGVLTARFACAFLVDKLFSAEQAPSVSQYGKDQRNIARSELENILTGEAFLFGQEITGRRFVRGTLIDAYGSPAQNFQKGQEKE